MLSADGHPQKYHEVRHVLLVTLILNWAVAAGKLVVGWSSNTLAMVADGYHSLLDGGSNIVGLIAIHYAYKPADEDHQYGHRKYEAISAMGISVGLFAAAWHILSDAFRRIQDPELPEATSWGFGVMIATVLVNWGVSRYEKREGTRLQSQLLLSDSAHTGSDVWASLAVIAALVAARLGVAWLDTAASLAIALVIVRTGYEIVRSGLSEISDHIVLDPRPIEKLVTEIAGVEGCERVRSRGAADHVFVDLVCYVPGSMSMAQAHDLADRIEARIQEHYPEVKDIVVHLEPSGGSK